MNANMRAEKAHLLHTFTQKNRNGRWSSKKLSMDSNIEEIKDELDYIIHKSSNEDSKISAKKGLMLLVDAISFVNRQYGGIDLDDWSKDMHWQLFNENKYDEVIEELVQKYRCAIPMSPELKLLSMFLMGLGMSILMKRKEEEYKRKRDLATHGMSTPPTPPTPPTPSEPKANSTNSNLDNLMNSFLSQSNPTDSSDVLNDLISKIMSGGALPGMDEYLSQSSSSSVASSNSSRSPSWDSSLSSKEEDTLSSN